MDRLFPDGTPVGFRYNNGTTTAYYYYVCNWRGDVVAIYSNSGLLCTYDYDAWGKVISVKNASGEEVTGSGYIANFNPGYYYDYETGLYYVNSRYYDPETHRFVNADDESTVTGTTVTDKNLFAYCDYNPVTREDYDGDFWHIVVGAATGGLINAGMAFYDAYNENGSVIETMKSGKTWGKVGVSLLCGVACGAAAASGVGLGASVAIGAASGGFESLGHELISKDFKLDKESFINIGAGTAIGAVGGAFSGKGAIHGNKYMTKQYSRLISHSKTQGIKKAVNFCYKMTNTLSKRLIRPTFKSVVRGYIAGGIVKYGIRLIKSFIK